MGIALLVVLVTTASPPSGPIFEGAEKESDDTDIMKPGWKRQYYWVFFSVRYFFKFLGFQITVWTLWV
ncbi:hypothetical protein FRC08_009267, partial [Ceratobasidium sp. 394]